MNRERLQAVVDVLKAVPPNEFSIDHWDCGTTACAIGWAIRRGAMPGWTTRAGGFDDNKRIPIPPFGYCKRREGVGIDLYISIAYWFGISRSETLRLFCPERYADESTPQEVIDRINKLMEKGS